MRTRTTPLLLVTAVVLAAAGMAAVRAARVRRQGLDCPSLQGRRLFPPNNPWNQDITNAPVDPHSAQLVAEIGASAPLHPDFGTVWNGAPNGIPYITVPGSEPLVPVTFTAYGDESDPSPYPIPLNAPIEGGSGSTGDRHVIAVDIARWKLYELFGAYPTATGWNAASGAVFDLNSNKLRPAGWTSADAAGLPILPGLVRYDEVVGQGAIHHALRFTVEHTRHAYVYPARHYASSNASSSLPPMGMRVRLKASFDDSNFPPQARVILECLKHYGMFLADNGGNWFISGAPDTRWDDNDLHSLTQVTGSDLEVVKMPPEVTH